MCNRRGWHETEGGEFRPLYDGLTLGQKCMLHEALYRDYYLTLGETLAKLTAGREAARESFTVAALPGLTIIVDEDQEPGTISLVSGNQKVTAFNIGTD